MGNGCAQSRPGRVDYPSAFLNSSRAQLQAATVAGRPTVLAVIGDILDELQLARERIVKVEVHLSDLADIDAMDAAYRRFFDGSAYPARTTTESRRLFGGSKVEITCQVRR